MKQPGSAEAAPSSQKQELLHVETMLADLSARFVNLSADRINADIEQGTKIITETLKIARCSVAQISSDRSQIRLTHGWVL